MSLSLSQSVVKNITGISKFRRGQLQEVDYSYSWFGPIVAHAVWTGVSEQIFAVEAKLAVTDPR